MKHDPQSPYYSELSKLSFSPGWARAEPSMWPQPKPKFKPAVWRFAAAKRALDASHNMVPAEQTERRNLIMVNPIEGNTYASTRHLVAAYQCVMSGDTARTHRHSAAALRLVLAGKPGTYTVVDGARIDMAPGDVVLTPAWCWHGHANESDETSYWIDFLDIPVHPAQRGDVLRAASVRSGSRRSRRAGRRRCAFPRARRSGPGRDAKTVEIAKDVMPTIALHLIRQPKGGRVESRKSTTNNIYAVVSGKARITAEGGFSEVLDRGDVAAMPCWHAHAIEAVEDAVVFRVTDEPILSKLGLVRTAN